MLIQLFPSLPEARQLFAVGISLVQTSCGMGVPYFDFRGNREDLNQWAVGDTFLYDTNTTRLQERTQS